MDSTTAIAIASIVTAGMTIGIGCLAPALGEGKSVSTALTSLRSSRMLLPPSLGRSLLDWQ
jgi:F0F1-type ATP synthase membrane subunit c/vacuolar-type H+-ATPase subunit K